MMLVKEALAAIGGSLGFPSKMPGTSYGISAHACKTGSKLAQIEGSVCHGCYALKGNYIYRDVKKAHANRLASIDSPQWPSAMAFLLLRSKTEYHRWHDSGDLQSVHHLAQICIVAKLTKNIRHWLPTRELSFVLAYVADGGVIPANLVIRVSATMVDGPATTKWPTTSGVHHNAAPKGRVCPAPTQGNSCGDCRACWSPRVKHVSYHKH